ncbi:MAG: hypothetical protein KatS3mg077_0669 [Candidatus Binatia bacterium]|nr:MAG: hypothetical protein KatS3mg077_0669 [Candidatus Binatia bacterium]
MPLTRLARALLREPSLWFFLAAGAALLVWHRLEPSRTTITIARDQLAEFDRAFAEQWGRPPTNEEREQLVEDFVRQEILWREGLRLGLERADPIVRRRVVQKMTFLLEAARAAELPDEATLQEYYRLHADRYLLPERVSFIHVFRPYESPNGRPHGSPADLPANTLKTLRPRLQGGEEPEALSAPFLRGLRWTGRPTEEVERTFGADFLATLRSLPLGTWSDPTRSIFGWHLVKVEAWHAPELPALETVRRRVEQDWLEAARTRAREEGLRRLRERYRIVVEATTPERP